MYTFRERTVKSKTVGDALASAERVLRKRGIRVTCTNAISGKELSDKITIAELNEIADRIISDTEYHAVPSDFY